MIRAVVAAAVLALAVALPARAIDIQVTTSPGGIESWLVEDHSIPFTALTIMFRGGASVDPPGQRGAINLMTGLLEEGARDMDATAFAEAVEATGAVFRFDASDEAVSVTARLLTDTRDKAADLLAAALTAPRFDRDAVARVKGQVEAIIRREDTDPETIAQKALARTAWGQHPLGTSINGTLESVAPLGPEDMRAAKERVMARDRVVVAAAGDIDAEALGALLDRVLGALPFEATAPLPPKIEPSLGGGVEVIDWQSPQTVVAFAQPGLALDDPDFFPALIANYVLGGGGFSSRLTDEIREKRGLTYGVGTGLSTGLFGNIWAGGMAVANASVGEALDLVRAAWRRMAEEGVTPEELETAKTYLTGEYPLRFDGNARIAGILGGMQLMGMPADYVNTRNAKIEAVTLEDVARVARSRIAPGALTFVLVGQPEGL